MVLNIVSDLRAADFSRVEYFFSQWWKSLWIVFNMVARKNYRAARAVRFLVKNFDVVTRTTSLNLEISRCHLANYVKELYQSACRTCSTIIFTHSTNQIIIFWRRRCSCRRPCLKLPKLPEVVFRGRSVETLGLGS